jgi:hypothetical protein
LAWLAVWPTSVLQLISSLHAGKDSGHPRSNTQNLFLSQSHQLGIHLKMENKPVLAIVQHIDEELENILLPICIEFDLTI